MSAPIRSYEFFEHFRMLGWPDDTLLYGTSNETTRIPTDSRTPIAVASLRRLWDHGSRAHTVARASIQNVSQFALVARG